MIDRRGASSCAFLLLENLVIVTLFKVLSSLRVRLTTLAACQELQL